MASNAEKAAFTAERRAIIGGFGGGGVGGSGGVGRRGGTAAVRPPIGAPDGGGAGAPGGGGASGASGLPVVTASRTTAEPPPELTKYSADYQAKVLGGYDERLSDLKTKGGQFMEEEQRQARESTTARLQEARQRAREAGVPFDEAAAMRDIAKIEAGGRAEGKKFAEGKIDETLGARAGAYTSGTGIVQAPSQTALAQRAQSSNEEGQLMNYWLGSYGAETSRMAANQAAQNAWMGMLSNMLNVNVGF